MKIRMDEMIRCFSMGLDAVESDFLGSSTNHGMRIATLSIAMGKHLGMEEKELNTLACCALLHDNALTEYILSEQPSSAQQFNMVSHCILGQRNASALPFQSSIDGLILFHHERADGKGPFLKEAGDFPLGAALIAIADNIDSKHHLQRWDIEALPELHALIKKQTGTNFVPAAADALLHILDEDMLQSLKDDTIILTFGQAMPEWEMDLSNEEILRMSSFVGRIIDYKSAFTKRHSSQVANMAWHMGNHYGFDEDMLAKLYLAASLHDIGKLFVSTDILEKDGPLDAEEFKSVKNHVWWTREGLSQVTGLEDVCTWASNHHEKLDGSGYPDGISAHDLDFVSRLLACIDIYQAVSDHRPYHPRRSHEDTIAIMTDMVYKGCLDKAIVGDMDQEMRAFIPGEVPPPPIANG